MNSIISGLGLGISQPGSGEEAKMRGLFLRLCFWPPLLELKLLGCHDMRELDILRQPIILEAKRLLGRKEQPVAVQQIKRRMIFHGVTFKREDPYGV